MRRHFTYLRPETPAEAVQMKADLGDRARYWAGGTDLLLQWQRGEREFDCCVDITFIDGLDRITFADGTLRIGALASLAQLERANGAHRFGSYLGSVAKVMCTPQTRTLATVGGNLCNASPAADLAPPLLALDAELRVLGPGGERMIGLDGFFTGVNTTALEDAELLLEVCVPLDPERSTGFGRVGRTSVDVALVVAAASLARNGGSRVGAARIALGSVSPTPIRCQAAEELLLDADVAQLDRLVAQAARLAAEATKPITDVRTTAAYRAEVSRVLVERALSAAASKLRAEGGRS
jgi:carbon-monoxide dehydrogenase medium subunit